MRLSGKKSYNSITLHRQTMLSSINFKFGIWNFELNPEHSKKPVFSFTIVKQCCDYTKIKRQCKFPVEMLKADEVEIDGVACNLFGPSFVNRHL